MESFIQILIIIHASFGGIALAAGLIAMIARKGLVLHRKSGLVFYYTMMISAITAMVVGILPKHESPFLFAIGVFSLYFVVAGKRALRFKKSNPNLTIDFWIARTMIVTGILMIFLPVILSRNLNIVLVVFGGLGIVFAFRDIQLYKKPAQLKAKYLKLHLGKTIGGYISASTAFVVVNQFFPSFYGWFIPGIIGGMIIIYWIKKVDKQKVNNSVLLKK